MLCFGCHNGGSLRLCARTPFRALVAHALVSSLSISESYFALVVLSKEPISLKLVVSPMWLENFNVCHLLL